MSIPAALRLQRLLVSANVARSRRAADGLISEGRVLLNGSRAALGARVDFSARGGAPRVMVDGRAIHLSPPPAAPSPRVVAVNKPRGMVSAWGVSGPRVSPRATLDSLNLGGGLMHVGRLDADSEGLLLITNDGTLANKIAHPSTGPPKTYVLTVSPASSDAPLMAALCARLIEAGGVVLPADERDGPAGFAAAAAARPARALAARHLSFDAAAAVLGGEPPRTAPDADYIELVLSEGRKRLARRLVAACGWKVDRLVRSSVGPVRLAGLASGESRELSALEIAALLKSTTLARPPPKGGPKGASTNTMLPVKGDRGER